MKSRPTSPCEFLKNASAKLDRPHSAKIAKGRLLSVSSALFVLKVSSPFEQSFQHRGHRDHGEDREGNRIGGSHAMQCKTGIRRADFFARNVWAGGLGRT